MLRATTNKSLRRDDPTKALRRQPIADGEIDEHQTAGASGPMMHARRRPGRAASLRGTSQRTRSQKWRSPAKGPTPVRRGVLAKGSHTGRKRGA